MVESARNVFVTGIGASWHAAISAGALLHGAGHPVYMQEAAELLHFTTIPRGSVIIIAVSRTSLSIEIVQLLSKAEASSASVVGITNSAHSPFSRGQ
jgi:fructoselysine-6-P-deglycase FrlB-like protein